MDAVTLIVDQIAGFIPPLFEVGFATVALASAIAALTPTPRDDDLAGKAYKLLELLALNVGYAKDAAPNAKGGRFVPD